MKGKYFSLFASLLCFFVLFVASACNKGEGGSFLDSSIESSQDSSSSVEIEQTPLTVPQPCLETDYSV